MHDAEKQITLTVNGEIYNYQELRKELELCGYLFMSHSDSEVIVHGYKQWGIDVLLERLDGMFAFALYDKRTRDLFLVRDRMGVKPLYFSMQQDIISFASEIKALWQMPWIEKKIRADAAYHYLTYLATPAPMTLFEGVYKIPAGFYLHVNARKEMRTKRWYDLAQRIALRAVVSDQQHVDELHTLLKDAVKKRMMSDVSLGVFLSGGVDSSLIVALAAEQSEQMHTFTMAFSDGPEYNELVWARDIADRYATKHHELVLNEADAFNFFQKMVYHQDEPLGDCVCIPLYFVAKLAKDHGVSVVQVGEGADELFCGYQQYADYLDLYPSWHATQRYVPQFARKSLFYAAQKIAPDKVAKLDLMRNWSSNKQLFFSGALVCTEYMKEQQLKSSYMPLHDPMLQAFFPEMYLVDSYALADWHRAALLKVAPDADELQQMSYMECMHRLPELLLMRVDKMSMAVGVEAREPFLDYRLVEYALSLPMRVKYRNGITKYILKKAAEGIIPYDTIYRKKIGFAAPTTRWFKQGVLFNEYISDMLQTNKAAWQHILDLDAVAMLQQQNKVDEKIDYSYRLWAIQNLLAVQERL
jgi:asparagine synthase (glutamine-hydrolysing)